MPGGATQLSEEFAAATGISRVVSLVGANWHSGAGLTGVGSPSAEL